MKSLNLKAKLTLAGMFAAAALILMPAVAFAGYAPSSRPTFQCITPTNCPGADYVVFNSFTNAPNYGDERAFFDGKSASITGPGGYQDKINNVKDGDKYVVRIYVHNNANPKKIGDTAATAVNTKLMVLLPTSKRTGHTAGAQITADNASPKTVSDTVEFYGDREFTLSFDKSTPVQVTYRPNGTGSFVTKTLHSASFVSDNALSADLGKYKGCFEYSALITMAVKVKMDNIPPPPPPPEKPPETPPETPPEVPEKPQPEQPKSLPNTGPAAVFTTFLGVSSISALLHRLFTRRQF